MKDIPPNLNALTIAFVALLILETAGGLLIPGLYRDGVWVDSAMRSSDYVTLFLVVPLLVLSTIYLPRFPRRAGYIWLGCVYYALYFNMYYLVGIAFNRLFLDYAAVSVVGAFALLRGLQSFGPQSFPTRPASGSSTKWAAGFMILFAAILGLMWIGQWGAYAFTGKLPEMITINGDGPHLVAALDLTMVVAPAVFGAHWLWRGSPWGRILSAPLMIMCLLTCIVLVVSAPVQTAAGVPDAWNMVTLWVLLGLICLAPAALLWREA